jgi:diguanylate cyclase (GGDEF)-like protein/PAS domain S-box-containing protein
MENHNEAYYQRIFEDAPIGMYRSTPDGKLVDGNKALVDMLGYPDLESLKKVDLADLYVDPKKRVEKIELHLKSKNIRSLEIQLRRRDGATILVQDTARVFRDEDGNPIYFEGVLEDITERVQAERVLQKTRRKVETERAQRMLAETLRDIANLITGTLELDKVIQQIFMNLERLISFDSASLFLFQDEKIQIVAAHKIDNIEDLRSQQFSLREDPITRQIAETRQPIILNNPLTYPYFKNYGKNHHLKSWLGVPLIARNKVIGQLTLDSSEPYRYKEPEMQIALALASQIAVAIENARLFTEERHRADVMSALRATLIDITSELDLTTLLQSILKRAISLLNVVGGELTLYDEAKNEITVAVCQNMDKDYTGKKLAPGRGAIGQVIQNREAMVIDDYSTWDGHFDARPWRGVMVVPLMARDHILGAIALADAAENRKFDQSDVRLILLFAHQAAIAIENAQLFEKIQLLAETDELTQTNNRRQLFALGEQEFNHAKRYQHPLSVLMLDIDDFKKINDQYGHATGDIVLYELAQYCQNNIRDVDILGRYGGEEFVIIMPSTNLDQGCELAERLRAHVKANPIPTKNTSLQITISIGVVEATLETPNLAALIDQADTALYKAKEKGKNRVECAGQSS